MTSLLGSLIAPERILEFSQEDPLVWSQTGRTCHVACFSCVPWAPRLPPLVTLLYLPLKITGLALHIFSKLSGTDTGSPEATTGKVTEAGPTKPTWGMQVTPVLSRDTPRALRRHVRQSIHLRQTCRQAGQHICYNLTSSLLMGASKSGNHRFLRSKAS